MIFKLILCHFLINSCKFQAQILANFSNIQILVFSQMGLSPYTNASSVYYPNDTIASTAVTPTHLYALCTNNVLQVYDKSNSSIPQQNVTQFFLNINQSTSFQFMAMVFDEDFSTLVLSAFSNSTLIYVLYNIANDSLPIYSSTLNSPTCFSYSPLSTFIANSIVYSFFSAAATNDTLFGLRLNDNSTFTITLPTKNSSIAISPNHKYGLVWTEKSQVYIFNVTNNFSLLYIYNGSIINQAGTTQAIKFSQDSTFALLQTDNHNPVQVINLVNFSVQFSITIHKKIISAEFLDITNRFILIDCAVFTYVYDTVTSTLVTFNSTLSETSQSVDQNSSQIVAEANGLYTVWGINITINGNITFWPNFDASSCSNSTPAPLNVSNNTNNSSSNSTLTPLNTSNNSNNSSSSPISILLNVSNNSNSSSSNSTPTPLNITNNTNNSSSNSIPTPLSASNSSNNLSYNSTPPAFNVDSTPFSYFINTNSWENQTLQIINTSSLLIGNTLIWFNQIVFSSPLVCIFLGFFNYFVLNSIYVLLNMPLPDIVFTEVSSIYNYVNTNLLNTFGIQLTPPNLTHELVDQDKALYFDVSSDILETNFYPAIIIALNFILIELLLTFRNKIPKTYILYNFLDLNRQKIYFGFIISIMMNNILPWKYLMFGQKLNWATKINAGCYYFLFTLIIYFICINLLDSLDDLYLQKMLKKKVSRLTTFKFLQYKCSQKRFNRNISRLPEWMIVFHNFLYPLLVLLSSPMYFLIIILFSKAAQVIIFIKHSKKNSASKFFQICIFVCELVYHSTFFIFAFCTDESVIAYNSIVCLGFFFLGAALNFVLVLVFLVSVAIKICKASKRSNQIAQMNSSKQFNEIEQINFQSQNFGKLTPRFKKLKIMIIREYELEDSNKRKNDNNIIEYQRSKIKKTGILKRKNNKNMRFEFE